MATNPPVEDWNGVSYEDYEIPLHYSAEQDVYDATGYDTDFIQTMGDLSSDQVTTLINRFIASADGEIRRRLGIPFTVRKEAHEFFNNVYVQLGPDREDEYEFFGVYEPLNKVVAVYSIWYNNYKVKPPYPKNIIQFTEPSSIDYWDVTNGTVEAETDSDYVIMGTGSIYADLTGVSGGSVSYPKDHNLNLRIYPWLYAGFMFMTDEPEAIFTFKIVRDTGSYFYTTFNTNSQIVSNTNQVTLYQGFGYLPMTWVPMSLNIRNFQFSDVGGEGAQPNFNWMLTPTQYIEISSDRPCKIWVSGINFNDGFYASCPQGYIYWSMPMWYPSGKIEVTYSYDPYIYKIPQPINEASSKWAGAKLLDWLIGKRQKTIAFDQDSDTLEERADKVTLEATRKRLREEGEDALRTIGFDGSSGIA